MAYHLTYTATFNNQITENIVIELYRKDIIPDQVNSLRLFYCNKKIINGKGDKFDCILSSELNFGIFVGVNDTIEFDDLLVSFSDEWKVILKNDSQIDFIGFIVPNEGQASFRDKPYDIEITCTDGLGYLRDQKLTNINGDNFNDARFLKDYVAGALRKTNLDLNIRIYCNIYESSFPDRNTDSESDMFNRCRLDYRTFQTSPTEFMSCYDALLLILKQGFVLFQWFGKWVIMRIGELQQSIGPLIWFTEYDYTSDALFAQIEDFSAAQVARQQILHPINADQIILSRFAIRYARTSFKYEPWFEIPKNNKFERGTVYQVTDLGNGLTEKRSTIDDWVYGVTNPGSPSTFPPDGMLPTSDQAYRASFYDIYGTEQGREVVLERNGGPVGHRFLVAQKVPVHSGDRMRVSVDYKRSSGSGGTRQYLMIMLEPPSGLPYRLDQAGGIPSDGVGTLYWKNSGALTFLAKDYQSGDSALDYSSIILDVPAFPTNGDLYFVFVNFDPAVGEKTYYRGFSVEYFPYIAGGLSKVDSDYWQTEQFLDFKDISEEEIGISDSPIHVVRGSLLRPDGETLTNRTWHRLNVAENRDFKELINLSRYNAQYRRTWQVTGTFGGTMFHPANDQTIRLPLGFHKQFFFPNSNKLYNNLEKYFFQLVPPLTINYKDGSIEAIFVDCMKVDSTNESVDNVEGDLHQFKYVFKNG